MAARSRRALVALVVVLVAGCGGGDNTKPADPALRYVALGDSYTIGEGVAARDRWPNRLVRDLGGRIELVANPSVTGYTTQDVLTRELPVLERSNADLVTLQIGVNDYVRGASPDGFRANVTELLDRIPTERAPLVVVTIPDFASTPSGVQYTQGRNGTAGIARFNAILTDEAKRRGIPVADVFDVSKDVRGDPSLVAADGLHPSAKQYAAWEKLIRPVVERVVEGR